MLRDRLEPVFFVIVLAIVGSLLLTKEGHAQAVLCDKWSHGDSVIYGSVTTCSAPGYLLTVSHLYKYDPFTSQESLISSTGSGGFTIFDWAYTTNPDGSNGSYYTYGQHVAQVPGYPTLTGQSFWYFAV